jgi:hypothetical protein
LSRGQGYYFPGIFLTANTPTATFLQVPTPNKPIITIDEPASETEITNLSTIIAGSYSNFDITKYHDLLLSFQSNGINTNDYEIVPTGATGTFSFNLGDLDFSPMATLISPQISDVIISAPTIIPADYNLILNVDGLADAYTFNDFDTWYSANSSGGYSTPSDFASATAGFITPIFEKALNFANNGLKYFENTDAYANGKRLGVLFPQIQAYVENINVFFGGFPLIQLAEFAIVVMLGIFIIRTIFKFIPFFG